MVARFPDAGILGILDACPTFTSGAERTPKHVCATVAVAIEAIMKWRGRDSSKRGVGSFIACVTQSVTRSDAYDLVYFPLLIER